MSLTASQIKRNNSPPANPPQSSPPSPLPPSTPQSQSSPEAHARPGCSELLPPDPAPTAAENQVSPAALRSSATAPAPHQTPPASSGGGTRASNKSRRNIPPANSYPPLCSPPQSCSPACVSLP